MISINVIIFCNYMFCEVYKSHPWRHGYPPYIRRMTGGYPQSGPRVPKADVWTEEMKLGLTANLCGSGSGQGKNMRIRIRNPAFSFIFHPRRLRGKGRYWVLRVSCEARGGGGEGLKGMIRAKMPEEALRTVENVFSDCNSVTSWGYR